MPEDDRVNDQTDEPDEPVAGAPDLEPEPAAEAAGRSADPEDEDEGTDLDGEDEAEDEDEVEVEVDAEDEGPLDADEPPPLALPLWKLVAGGVAVVVVVVAVVVGAIVLLGEEDDGGSGGGDEPAAQASIVDSFDRADAPDELGATESGQTWEAASGVWGVEDEQAVLVEPNPDGQRSIVVVDLGSSNGTVSTTAGTMTTGWGMVFRYRGPFNFWYLTAAPEFATFNLARVVDGVVQPLGSLGLAAVEDGTVVQVRLDGATIEISVNGNPVKAITDTTLMGATQAGLLASGQSAATATWDSFEATPTGAPAAGGGGGVSPETVPAPAGATTTSGPGTVPAPPTTTTAPPAP
jgi:hypothetical protein